jgi:nitroimidazol reductase NimA-like FMN-containing flavoprotein (pyridoxamine 5'-phosphate oxidase superfamily)
LTRDEAWRLLRGKSVGRLVVVAGGHPDVLPLNFLADEQSILVRTGSAALVDALAANENVAFEVDSLDGTVVWSVVVRGRARVIRDEGELELVRRAPLWTWPKRETEYFVRIEPSQVNGRTFDR